MKAVDFVKELRELAPPREKLLELGVSEAKANEMIDSYNCVEANYSGSDFDDSLLSLLIRYNLSKVVIGLIEFKEGFVPYKKGYIIGNVEVDYLILDKNDGEIKVFEFDAPDHLLWRCASSSEKFLDALIVCASFLTATLFSDSLYNDADAILQVSNDCARIAGNEEEYGDFYKMLLGYF